MTVSAEPNGLPLFWEQINYTYIHSQFYPVTERGKDLEWHIDSASDGDLFLVMSTGAVGTQTDTAVTEAKVWQHIYLPAWTLIQGVYFFGTSDYRPYYDYGLIKLVPYIDPNNPCDPNDPNNFNGCNDLTSIEIVRCSVDDVGDFGSTDAWIPFSYTILPQQEGFYDFVATVNDGTDSVYESYFAVDALTICGPMTPLGDVNKDCSVDMDDLSFFSREWLKICSIDPNSIPDPNSPDYIDDPNDPGYIDPNNLSDPNCLCADFDRNNIVDANDLYPLQINWLINDL